jgi:GNAT superfamily N-acetyltransferase
VGRASNPKSGGRQRVLDAGPDRRTLLTLSPRTVMAKARERGWSTRQCLLVTREVDGLPREPAPTSGVVVSFVDPASFPELRHALPDAHDRDRLGLAALERTRAHGAGELVIARHDGEIAAVHFIHTAAHGDRLEHVAPRMYQPLREDEALTEGVFVFPAFRGRGIAPRMLRASTSELGRRGFRRCLAVIDLGNVPSLRAFAAAGYDAGPIMRTDSYRLGRRTSRFVAADVAARRRYHEAVRPGP